MGDPGRRRGPARLGEKSGAGTGPARAGWPRGPMGCSFIPFMFTGGLLWGRYCHRHWGDSNPKANKKDMS